MRAVRASSIGTYGMKKNSIKVIRANRGTTPAIRIDRTDAMRLSTSERSENINRKKLKNEPTQLKIQITENTNTTSTFISIILDLGGNTTAVSPRDIYICISEKQFKNW